MKLTNSLPKGLSEWITGILPFMVCTVFAQNPVNKMEYFFDSDPGFGNAINVTITPSADITSFAFSPSIATLPPGFHQLSIRTRDSLGNWSLTNSASFIKYVAQNFSTGPSAGIMRLEYFIDVDPGFGNATNIPLTGAPDINNIVIPLNITTLTSGFHTLSVRSCDSLGRWSLTNSNSFIKYAAQSAATGPLSKVNYAEYFIDTDPGFGGGTNIPLTAGADISNVIVPISLISLPAGFHTLSVRSRDTLGRWSLTNSSSFVKYAAQTVTDGTKANLNKVEYFIDADPGFGSGVDIPVTPGNDLNNLIVSINLASIPFGLHTFSVRSRDSLGRWSLTNSQNFIKYTTQNLTTGTLVPIIKAEYFIDNDPGFGNGIAIPVTTGLDLNGLAVAVDLSTLRPGFHTISIRTLDSLGRWSITNNSSFIKYAPQDFTLRSRVNLKKMEYFIDADPGFGNGTNVPLASANDISNILIPVDLSSVAAGFHNFHIRSQDSSGLWSITNHGSFVGGSLAAPTATINIVGTQPLCPGTGFLKVNRDASPLATYQWRLNNNNIPGATDSIYYPTQSGTYSVVVTNPVGTATATDVAVIVYPVTNITITATGPTTFCEGGSVRLEASSGFSNYLWNNQTFGPTLIATVTDSFVVEANDANGCKVRKGIRVTVKYPGQSTVSRNICAGESFIFNGQNLTSPGSYRDTLTASNGCDSIITLNLTVNPKATNTLSVSICNGSSYVFNGQQLTASGTYFDTLQTVNGCDSVITLNLQVNTQVTTNQTASICLGQSYPFGGNNLTADGIYRDTLVAQGGCDSVVTLNLTVNRLPDVSWSNTTDIICIDDSPVNLSGGTPAGGTYSGVGVTGSQFSPVAAGIGSHVITYTYTDNNACSDTTTKTYNVVYCTRLNGLDNHQVISIFPNPVVNELMLHSTAFNVEKISPLVYDIAGQAIMVSFTQKGNQLFADVSKLAGGMYVVRLFLKGELVSIRFVK